MNQKGQDFLELSGISAADVSFDSRSFSIFDYDHDGFQDFVLVNANRPFVQVFHNRFAQLLPAAQPGNSIHLRLQGGNRAPQANASWSNRDGIGSQIRWQCGDQTFLLEYRCGEGLGAQNSSTLNLGLGAAKQVDHLEILWPSGRVTKLGPVAAGVLLLVEEGDLQSEGRAVVQRTSLQPLSNTATSTSSPSTAAPQAAISNSPELARLLAGKTSAPHSLVVSWFSSCAACKKAEPTLEAIRKAFPEKELGVFGLNNRPLETRQQMEAYRARYTPAYTMLLERSPGDIEAFQALQDQLLPASAVAGGQALGAASALTPGTLLVDSRGRVLAAWAGVPTLSELKQRLSVGP